MMSPYATDARYAPEALERDRLFDCPVAADAHFYCIHCERAYERGYFRMVRSLQMCPYEGCDGDAVIDAWLWTDIADDQNPGYPATPELGKVYPMHGHSA